MVRLLREKQRRKPQSVHRIPFRHTGSLHRIPDIFQVMVYDIVPAHEIRSLQKAGEIRHRTPVKTRPVLPDTTDVKHLPRLRFYFRIYECNPSHILSQQPSPATDALPL